MRTSTSCNAFECSSQCETRRYKCSISISKQRDNSTIHYAVCLYSNSTNLILYSVCRVQTRKRQLTDDTLHGRYANNVECPIPRYQHAFAHTHNWLISTYPFSYLRRASESGLEVEHAVRAHSGGALASFGARQQQLRGGRPGDRDIVRLLARALVHLAHYAVHCAMSGRLTDWRRPEHV